jgi:nicotinamidase/pyrazinamidase
MSGSISGVSASVPWPGSPRICCVLTTAMDALCHDFKAVIREDCTMSGTLELHLQTLNTYRRHPLVPLLRVLDSDQFFESMSV